MDRTSADEEGLLEPGKLLENCWFFGNPAMMMSRSFSDPSNCSFGGKSYPEIYESIEKLSRHEDLGTGKVISRASTVPASVESINQSPRGRRKSSGNRGLNHLPRALSMPTDLEIIQQYCHDEEEMEFSMGNLIRQASINSSDTVTATANPVKGATTNSSISKRKPKLESLKLEGLGKLKPRHMMKLESSNDRRQSKLELQAAKDLGLDMNAECSPETVGIGDKDCEDENWRRVQQSSAQAVPKPSTEDVKAQIKFWARAVASSVRQEC